MAVEELEDWEPDKVALEPLVGVVAEVPTVVPNALVVATGTVPLNQRQVILYIKKDQTYVTETVPLWDPVVATEAALVEGAGATLKSPEIA